MIKFFRTIRQQLITERKLVNYILYAVGEIVLVVIGILIALQINNNNDLRKARAKEMHYLQNIKTDLQTTIGELDRYLDIRSGCIEGAHRILGHFGGVPVEDFNRFNEDCISIFAWQKFYQSNNTFQELLNSGNLGLLTNDTIKNLLLDIESLYKKLKSEEDHFRYDTEELIYSPIYGMMDLSPMVDKHAFHASGGNAGSDEAFAPGYFDAFFKSTKLKNGFLMTVIEFQTMNAQMRNMKKMAEELIAAIDTESSKPS